MPNLKVQKRINVALQYIRFSNRSGSHVNCFRYFPNNTDNHEDAKYKLFKMLRKKGHSVLIEPIFTNGSRCDVLDLTAAQIYEVMETEDKTSMIKKALKYPYIFALRGLYAAEILEKGFIL